MFNKKILYLEQKKAIWGDFACHFIDKSKEQIWETFKPYSIISDKEKDEVNLIRSFKDEIILDVEDKFRVDEIKLKLKENGFPFYSLYNTGSRGVHFHLLFDNLADKPEDLRNRIRKYIISIFNTDLKLSTENQWIACPYAKHMKTGNTKELVEEYFGNNHLKDEIIEYCKKDLEIEKVSYEIEPDENFKDFLNDPYLKYCLQNKIIDGERNGILFKNLAIGLVKSGLEKEEILKIAAVIVNNCPGKSIGEFMGWVEKAGSGELTDFNRSEIIKWAIKYGHPVFYKMHDEEQIKEIMPVKTMWNILWDSSVARQPTWRDMCFYNMLGTVIDESEEDYRVHVIFSCASSSGKDEGTNLVETTLMDLDIPTSRPSSATDKTLVGAPNQMIEEYNIKNGLDEINKENEKGKKWKNPIEYGILATCKWIAFTEAETVFSPSHSFNKQLHSILRLAMDKGRKVEKGVGGKIVKYNTNASFLLVSYPIENQILRVINNGIFQRSLFYHKDITEEDHDAIVKHVARKMFNTDLKLNFNEKEYRALIVNKLKDIKQWYNENRTNIKPSKDIETYTSKLVNDYKNEYEHLIPADKDTLNSMIRRGIGTINKIAILNAISNKRTELIFEDIDIAFRLLKTCLDSIRIILGRQEVGNKQEAVILSILSKEDKTCGNVYQEIETNLGIKSTATKNKLIKKIKNLGYVEEYQDGKYKKLRLTNSGKEVIGLE